MYTSEDPKAYMSERSFIQTVGRVKGKHILDDEYSCFQWSEQRPGFDGLKRRSNAVGKVSGNETNLVLNFCPTPQHMKADL